MIIFIISSKLRYSTGLKDASVDLNNTFLTTVKSLNGFLKKLTKNSKVFSSNSAVYGNIKTKLNENHINFFQYQVMAKVNFYQKYIFKIFVKNKIKYNW